jgi:uncharacterized membrane protein
MEIRKLNAARGWLWIKHGFQLILRNPLMSFSLALVCGLIIFIALNVPQFGPVIVVLLMPVLMAGYMRVCRALEEDEEIELSHLFNGFQKHAKPLFALGGITLLGMVIIAITMISLGGDELTTLLESVNSASDPQMLVDSMWAAGTGVALSITIGFALAFVLMLALQYAPMLVYFSDVPPIAALRASLAGTLRNFIPYTVYSLIMQVVALVLGLLPFGIGLVVLLPLGLTSLYVSYRNIFPFAGEIQHTQTE